MSRRSTGSSRTPRRRPSSRRSAMSTAWSWTSPGRRPRLSLDFRLHSGLFRMTRSRAPLTPEFDAMTDRPEDHIFDLAVIGGGVNGCGIARDAVGRGLSVTLCEQGDLAEATSSASTKLFHGGLRYLEYYEFRLVREALIEREVLLKAMPHIAWPLRFVLPHHAGLRPAWLLRLGLFIYDHLGGRKILPPTKTLDLTTDPVGKPLKPGFTRGFEYSDGWVQDSQMVALNARDAADRGASISTRTRVE